MNPNSLASPSDLRYFLEVASTSNVTRAAERLGITQPSLSLSLRRLENALGTQLLIRSKSGVQLTRSGFKVAAKARNLLAEWEQIARAAREEENEVAGRFALGCHPSVALYALPPFLGELLEKHPSLEINLAHGLSRQITEDVVSWRLDFGIVVNPVRHPDLVIHELCQDEVTLWKRASGACADVLICDPELNQTQWFLKELGKRSKSFGRVIGSSNLEVIARLVAEGCGAGVLPERVARASQGNAITRFDKALPAFKDKICLVYRADAPRTQASQAIVAAIRGAKY